MSKAANKGKTAAPKHKFIIDFSRPADNELFDSAAYEKFLHDRIKVDGKAGQLGDKVTITQEGSGKLSVSSTIPFSKRYLKYLTNKFLKKNLLREWIRVVAVSENVYELRFRPTGEEDEEEAE